MRLKIVDQEGLIKDTTNQAILNVDRAALLKDQIYKEKRKKETEMETTINNLKEEVTSIKGDISKILELLSSRGH
jgi:hypothetical protein